MDMFIHIGQSCPCMYIRRSVSTQLGQSCTCMCTSVVGMVIGNGSVVNYTFSCFLVMVMEIAIIGIVMLLALLAITT